jgi:hypothetical protein
VRGRSNQTVAVENGAQTRGRHSEIVHRAEKLDLFVARLRDVDERSLEVSSRIVAQGVELNSNLF